MKFILTHEFPFDRTWYGGGNQITRGLALQLARRGHGVHVVSSGRDEIGVTTADIPVKYHLTGHYNRHLFGLQTACKTLQLVRELRPDVVCSMTSEAAIVLPFCNFIRVPTAFFLAAPETPDFRLRGLATVKTIRYKVGLFLQAIGAAHAKRIVSLSNFISEQAHQNWRIPCRKLATVGTGLDDAFFMSPARARRMIGPKGPRFLSVGRLTLPQKPLHLIAEALATVNVPWHCWTIIGSGVDEQKLRERVIALGISDKTVFLGMQDSAQVAALLDAHDIALLPSRYESFFLTVYEAAAKGKIVVTNDVADIRAYFTGSPSVVVAQGVTPEDYRKSMVYTIEQFGYLQSTVSETADRIKHDYNWSAVAERFLQALR